MTFFPVTKIARFLRKLRKRARYFYRKLNQRRWLYRRQLRQLTPSSLLEGHFRIFSSPSHVCLSGFKVALDLLDGGPASIIETGTSAWGTDSTALWAKYVKTFGGRLWSVDIRQEPALKLGFLGHQIELVVEDSVLFLQNFASENEGVKIDLIYLDSFDVDWSDPTPAANHGWGEFVAIQPLVKPGTIVIIDDTPRNPTEMPFVSEEVMKHVRSFFERKIGPPGKGNLVFNFVSQSSEWEILHHSYNFVVRKMYAQPLSATQV